MEPIPQSYPRSDSFGPNPYKRQAGVQIPSESVHHQNPYSSSSPLRSHSPILKEQNPYQVVDTSEFRRSQQLLRHIREKEAQFLARQHQLIQPLLSTTQHLRQSMTDLSMQDSFNKSQSLDIGRHLASSTDIIRRNSSSPLRTTNNHHESSYSQPSVVDIPMTTLDLQQMKYADKLMRDNQQLESKVVVATNELHKVAGEQQRLQQMHDEICKQTHVCKYEINDLDQPIEKSIHHEIATQRHQNNILTTTINQTDHTRVEAVKKLRFLQQKREVTHMDCEENKGDIQQKLSIMKEIEAKRAFDTQKLDRVERQIQALQVELLTENRIMNDDQCLIDQLVREREDLMQRLSQLNSQYQACMSENEAEKRLSLYHSKRQIKILASKSLYNALDILVKSKQQQALNDFLFYCEFDERCHRALGRFANVLESFGRRRMSLALNKWYQTNFDPCRNQSQQIQLVDQQYQWKVQTSVLSNWIINASKSRDKQNRWARGFVKQFRSLNKLEHKELVRIFMIWREANLMQNRKQIIIRRILLRAYDSRRRRVFQLLVDNSQVTRALARQQGLIVAASMKQFQHTLLLKLREATQLKKERRLTRLALIFKAWKDGLEYHKYMMGQNVQTNHLNKYCSKRLLSSVFMELRLSKELQKFVLLNENLQNKLIPECSRIQSDILGIATQTLKKRKIRGMKCLARYSLSGAAGYFNKWRQINFSLKNRTGDIMKSFMMRIYRQTMHKAVLRWRNGLRFYQLVGQESAAHDQMLSQDQFKKQLKSLNHDIFVEDYRMSAYRQRALTGAINIYNKRLEQFGINRWRLACTKQDTRWEKARKLVKAKKNQLLRSAFRLYRQKVELFRQDYNQEARAQYYIKVRREALKRKIFNALSVYVHTFKHSQKYWKIVLVNLDMWVKRRAVVRWREQSNSLRETEKRLIQGGQSERFDSLNVNLGSKVKSLTEVSEDNKRRIKLLTEQGQRVLSNYFARYYYNKAERGIKKWRDRVLFEKHREQVIKQILIHQKKQRWYVVKQAFQNWISLQKNKENQFEIRQTQILGQDQKLLNYENQRKHFAFKNKEKLEIAETKQNCCVQDLKWQKLIEIRTRKQQDCNYQSQLRFIFQQWVQFVKRQKQFVKTITNVVQKSMWKHGFTFIVNQSSQVRDYKMRLRVSEGMRRMYLKKQCGSYLSKWRQHRSEQTLFKISVTVNETMEIEQVHGEFKDNVSKVNCVRSEKIVKGFKLANYLKAWQNVCRWQRAAKIKTQQQKQSQLNYWGIRSLKHWNARTLQTIKTRDHLCKFKQAQRRIIQISVLNAFKRAQKSQRNLINILGHIGAKFDKLALQSGLQMITNFVASKNIAHKQAKQNGARMMSMCLQNLYIQRKSQLFNELHSRMFNWQVKRKRIQKMMGYWHSRRQREIFILWKNNAHLEHTVDDVNEDGPIVEQVQHWKIRFTNMQLLMKDEKYTKLQIDSAVDISKSRVKELLHRSVSRVCSINTDDQIKPIVFDRWRQFVKLRKLIKYLLKNMENKLQPVKADLQVAFNKWRTRHTDRLTHLCATNRIGLVLKATVTETRLQQLDEEGAYKNDQIVEGTRERDQLFEGFVGGQRLAIALGRDNHEKAVQRAFSLLSSQSHKQKRDYLESLLQRNIQHIGDLKDQKLRFDSENQMLVADNEDLRQQSLDGFDIGRGAQKLSDDRERLSVDLADKAKHIKRLLEMNQQLTGELRDRLDRTASLQR